MRRVQSLMRFGILALVGFLALMIIMGGLMVASPELTHNPPVVNLTFTGWSSRVVQVATLDPTWPNVSIWSDKPMLRDMPGRTYHGRVVIEVWDKGEFSFYPSFPDEPNKTADLLQRAILALQSADTPVLITTPWSDEPVMGQLPGQSFRGRVVIELWDNQTIVAITGTGQRSDLAQRAIQKLFQIMRTTDFSVKTLLTPFPPPNGR